MLPPGPPPLPFVGNLFDIPKHKPWRGYRDLCAKYGDLVYLQALGQSMIVLGSANSAIEYLEKCSANTADRLPNPVIELSGQDVNFAHIRYDQWWRRHRRAFWQHFHPGVVSKYNPIQSAQTHNFLARLIEAPSNLEAHIRFSLAAALVKLVYDIDVKDEDDKIMKMVDVAADAIVLSTPGHWAVEIFPFLRHIPAWFPGAGFQKIFAECKAANDHLRDVPFTEVKEALKRGDVRSSVASELLNREGYHLPAKDEEILRNVCAVSVEGGTDTTASALKAFFLAMAIYPDVQRRAQAELDAVVGHDRLPDFSDSPALVYVNAIIKEVLRWHLVVPLSIPHYTMEEDEVQGYFIPARTVLIPNVWAILHDPEAYDSPDEFRPERFIRDGKLDPTVRDPVAFMFGFGRRRVPSVDASPPMSAHLGRYPSSWCRICPGRYFAHASLFIHIASVLHVFDIGPPLDENGQPFKVQYEQGHGLLSNPEDCRCSIKVRSPGSLDLVLESQRESRATD
ncbi:CyP450 monooxygenase [Trametes cingulata]|nr:CyP450 monooxygenase [Trametes cingulata]